MAIITGTAGNNTLLGTAVVDTISGLGGNDRLEGRGGNDRLEGGAGNDTLLGGPGIDLLIGGAGDDLYIIDNATEINKLTVDLGIDTVQSSLTYTLGAQQEHLTLSGIAALNGTGNAKPNELIGNSAANQLTGLGGADTLSGMGGNDTLTDTVGNDTANGGVGNDTVNTGVGNDTVDGGAGNDTLVGAGGDDRLLGGLGNDTITFDALDTRGVDGGGGNADVLKVGGAAAANLVLLNSGTTHFGGFEIIDLTAAGVQTVVLDAAAVQGLSLTLNVVTIRGTTDVVNVTGTWINNGIVTIASVDYQEYQSGVAIVRMTTDLDFSSFNLAPDAVGDSGTGFTTDEQVALTTGNVLTNDVDANEDALSVTAADATSAMSVTVTNNGDGTFGYDATGLFDSLAAGETLTDSFQYTVSDGHGGSDTATVSITITGVNDAVDAVNDSTSVNEDATTDNLATSVLSNDDDPDASDTPDIIAVTQGTNGTVTWNDNSTATDSTDDTLTYTADGGLLDALAVGETTTDSFTYTISDGHGSTDTATVTVTITGVNDAVDAVNDSASVNEDATTGNLATSVLSNDDDPDASDTPDIIAVTQGTNGSVIWNDNGTATDSTDDTLTYAADGGVLDALAVGETTTDTFTYTISDGHGSTDTATVTVTITGQNDAVDAVNDTAAVNEDATTGNLASSLLGNDDDPDASDTPDIIAVTQGTKGSVAWDDNETASDSTDDTLTYTADHASLDALAASETTTDSFTYTISDGQGTTDTATVTVTITGVNDNPDAENNTASVNEDATTGNLNTTVLTGDTDIDNGSSFAITAVTQGTNGAVSFSDGGTPGVSGDDNLTYAATGTALDALAVGETTTDSFTYTITDNEGATDTATVTVTITGVNDDVNADNDTAAVNEDATTSNLVGSLLSNDEDPDLSDVLRVTAAGTATKGLVTFNAGTGDPGDESVTYEANGSVLDALAAGETTTDSFTYTISDGQGTTDTATVTVTITGVNDNPDAENNTASVNEDATTGNLNTTVLTGDTDIDNGSSFAITAVTQGTNGAVSFSDGGTPGVSGDDNLTYAATGTALDALAVGETTTDSFTYTITDNEGATDTATVTVTITGVNDDVNADNDTAAVNEDATTSNLVGSLLSNDEDPDLSDVLRVTAAGTATKGLVTFNAGTGDPGDESVTYEANGSVLDALAAGETTTDSFTYTISDGQGTTDTATVTVTITGVNDDVNADNDTAAVNEDATTSNLVGSLLSNDEDPDLSDVLRVTAAGTATKGLVTFNAGTGDPGDESVTYEANGSVLDALAAGETTTDSFTYTISDGQGTTDTATVTVTITGVNDNPDAENNTASVNEDATTGNLNTTVLTGDTDIDNGSSFAITAVTQGTNGVVSFSDSGTPGVSGDDNLTYAATGSVLDALAVGETTTDSFTYTITDNAGATDTATVTVTVTGVNDDVNADDDTVSADEDDGATNITSSVLANDDDADTSDTKTIIAIDGPSTQGEIALTEGTLTYSAAGHFDSLAVGESTTDTFTYTVSDGHGSTDTATVTVTITGVNDDVNADNDTAAVNEDATTSNLVGSLLSNDEDPDTNDVLRVTAAGTATKGLVTFNAGTGDPGDESVTYEANGSVLDALAVDETTTDSFTYTISDGHGSTDTATVTVTITGVNDAPVNIVPGTQTANLLVDDQITIAGISVADADLGANDIEITLSTNLGTLSLSQTTNLAFTTGDGTDDTTMTFTGSLTNVNAALDDLIYLISGGGTATITLTSEDDQSATDTDTITVNVEASLSLAGLNGTNGFQIDGIDEGERSGRAVASAGDVNGDGFDDVIIGAHHASIGVKTFAGEAYIVFGKAGGFSPAFDLATLDGTNGVRLEGASALDYTGFSVASAGDVNGDGFADVIVGAARGYDAGTVFGKTFVVFGTDAGFAAAVDLGTLNGTNGFRIDGSALGGRNGYSVSSAGDVNGDGYDDMIFSAPIGGVNDTYVVFGKGTGFTSTFDLTSLNGTNGFQLEGSLYSGFSVSGAGDLNGDGYDDMFVGNPVAPGVTQIGRAYVVFGNGGTFPNLNLDTLNGTDGFRMEGVTNGDQTGYPVASAGDVNGDGVDDLFIGAPGADPNGDSSAGRSYVVFGNEGGFDSAMNVTALNGTNGFRLDGVDTDDQSSRSLSSAGDVNGDGYDDMLIGAFAADPGGDSNAGETYLVFGGASFASVIDLNALNGDNGFRIDGIDPGDISGRAVSAAGDVNGDGFDDLIIGAYNADGSEGESYVIFGGDFRGEAFFVGGDGNDTSTGNASANIIVGGGGNDTLTGAGGNDALTGGSGDDTLDGGADNDKLSGGSGIDSLNGGNGVDFLDGGSGNDGLFGNAGDDRLDGGLGDDLLQGDGGQDDIDLGAGGTDTVQYTDAGDGAAAGTQTGYDIVTGFQPGSDNVEVSGALQTALDDNTTDGIFTYVTDTALNFAAGHEALHVTQASSGFTDDDLVEDNWTSLLSHINTSLTVNSAAGDDALITVQGDTQTGIYYYVEASGDDNISEAELTLLGIVNSQLTTGDFIFAITA